MNRRSFITKALAAVAVVPLVGKLVNSQPVEDLVWEPSNPSQFDGAVISKTQEPSVWAALGNVDSSGRFIELNGKGYKRVPLVNGHCEFPQATQDWGAVEHIGISYDEDGLVWLTGPVDWPQRYIRVGQSTMWDVTIVDGEGTPMDQLSTLLNVPLFN